MTPRMTLNRKGTIHQARTINRRLGALFVGAFIRRESMIEGAQHLREAWKARSDGQRLLIICNHLSYIDSHVIELMLHRNGFREMADRLYHIAGQKTYTALWRRFFTFGVNTIKVFQSGANESIATKRRQAMDSFRAFKETIATNPVVIFPEGTRSRTGRIGRGVPTLVNYCRRNLILPMALQGTERMLGVGSRWPHRGRVVLRVGPPFIANASPGTDKQVEMSEYLKRVADLLDASYRPA